jgi:hypothetical protein
VALRRVVLVVCVVVATALGGAPAPRIGATTRDTAFTDVRDASATIRRLASTQVAPPSDDGPLAHSLCWERDYTDPTGDGPIDATSYRLTYDCQSDAWRLSVALAAPVVPSTFDSLAIEIDTDNDPNDGCDVCWSRRPRAIPTTGRRCRPPASPQAAPRSH